MAGRLSNTYVNSGFQVSPFIDVWAVPNINHCIGKAIDTTNECTTGGVGQTWIATQDGQSGLYRCSLAAGANNKGYIKFDGLCFNAAYSGKFYWSGSFTVIDANSLCFFGVGSDTDTAAHLTGLYFVYDGTNFKAHVGNGAAETTSNFTTPIVSNGWYCATITRNGSYWNFRLTNLADNSYEEKSVINTNQPSGVIPCVMWYKTLNAAAKIAYIDYTGLSPRSS